MPNKNTSIESPTQTLQQSFTAITFFAKVIHGYWHLGKREVAMKKVNIELAVESVERTNEGVKVHYKKGTIVLPADTAVPNEGTLRVQVSTGDIKALEKGKTVPGAVAEPAVAAGGTPTRNRDF